MIEEPDEIQVPSKTKEKKRTEALQEIGVALVELPEKSSKA